MRWYVWLVLVGFVVLSVYCFVLLIQGLQLVADVGLKTLLEGIWYGNQ